MEFYGLQKLTLLDFPERTACTVFTGGCNLRCPFCHNALLVTELSREGVISEEEMLSFLKKRKGLLDGVCITGGEPLLNKDIAEFIKKVKSMGFLVKLDTNGTFPDELNKLLSEKLIDYVAMDIKNSLKKYAKTAGIENFDTKSIEKSVEILKSSDVDFEFRTTVVKEFHTEEDIKEIAKFIGKSKYFLQQFVDSGNTICSGLTAVSKEEIQNMKNIAEPFVKSVQVRGI